MTYRTRTCHKRLARVVLGGMICAASVGAAAAAEYHGVAAGDHYIMIVDKNSIYQAGGYTRGWIVTLSDDRDDDPILSALGEFDCSQHRWRTISYTSRDEDGDVIESVDNDDLSWINVEPGTNGEDLQSAICSPSSMTGEALSTDNLADLLESYLDSQDSK
jgi:hypothetical protein